MGDQERLDIEGLLSRLAAVEAERNYYRLVAERLGQKSLTDAQDFSRIITNLRQTEEELRRTQEQLETTVAERTTELVRSNAELKESEELYRLVTNVAPNAITVADPYGVIRMVNPKALELFGHPDEQDVIGRKVFDWIAPESLRTAAEALDQLLTNGLVTDFELKFKRQDGTLFVGDASASLVRDPAGQPRMLVIVTADKTRKKHAEAERLKLQKLEAIGILAGGIAHDFNNLLQGVFGYIAIARKKIHTNPQDAIEMLTQAEQAVDQSVNLTSQLLTFAKGGKPVKEKIALRQTIENATRFALSGSGSTYAIHSADDLWTCHADGGQIGQVIQNLVLNASQAMHQSGTVDIAAMNVDLPRGANQLLPEGGRFVKIEVRDTGSGIPLHYLSKVFDPYFTTKPKGSGLGLATSYSIVKRHGGAITVSSEQDRGSTFCIYLPAVPGETPQATGVAPVSASSSNKGKGQVLIMDDEMMVRDVAGKMIESCGYVVRYAADGSEAVSKVREANESGTPFDVVILDLTVKGGMGGEEAIWRIREIAPGVKAVVSSGYADNSVISDYRAHGFDVYLNKPYSLAALKSCLNSLVGGKATPGTA
jgi:two-component system, cell cycle sensor histidine kinase and response regulator CckA